MPEIFIAGSPLAEALFGGARFVTVFGPIFIFLGILMIFLVILGLEDKPF